jgi:DNA polymerase
MARKLARSAVDYLPRNHSLPALRAAAAQCQGCDLYKRGTQTVFGEGMATASVLMVGEQPGDREDQAGHPFVGPAGRVLDKALEAAGIDRKEVFVTNAVKHFKWEPRGKRRIHKKPNAIEIAACRPWLDAEIAAVRPQVIVALGATAAQSLLGRTFRVTKQRGEVIAAAGLPPVVATVHPSAILRAITDEDRHREMANFISDLRSIPRYLATHKRAA